MDSLVSTAHTIESAFDPAQWMVVVAFHKSTSKQFPAALELAQQAGRYEVIPFGGTPMHVAGFAPTETDARLALALLDIVSGWKGVFTFSKGDQVRNKWTLVEILRCYLTSCRCEDSTSHCFTMIDDPSFVPVKSFSMHISVEYVDTTRPVEIDRYVFPCRLLSHDMKFEADHPASLRSQVQAAAVNHGCWICPRFDPGNLKKAGVATYRVEA
ncbi:MAG: hypothetical protein WC284_10410 [Candidimonas sp.]